MLASDCAADVDAGTDGTAAAARQRRRRRRRRSPACRWGDGVRLRLAVAAARPATAGAAVRRHRRRRCPRCRRPPSQKSPRPARRLHHRRWLLLLRQRRDAVHRRDVLPCAVDNLLPCFSFDTLISLHAPATISFRSSASVTCSHSAIASSSRRSAASASSSPAQRGRSGRGATCGQVAAELDSAPISASYMSPIFFTGFSSASFSARRPAWARTLPRGQSSAACSVPSGGALPQRTPARR